MSRVPSGWVIIGDLVRRFRAGPALVSYTVETDEGWRTRRARVGETLRGRRTSVEAEMRGSRWHVNGRRAERLDGCADIDLGASPVTNTLPINRVRLDVGSRIDLTAAWVRFPRLSVEPLRQSYERVGERLYVYRSESGFESEIEVDESGVVTRYGEFWQAFPDG